MTLCLSRVNQRCAGKLVFPYALWLIQRGRVTLVKAAELVGMNVDDFMLVCKENQVPVIAISQAELLQELAPLGSA